MSNDIEERLETLRRYGLEWSPNLPLDAQSLELRGLNLFQDGVAKGRLSLERSLFSFTYTELIQKPVLIFGEDGVFDRLPPRFLEFDRLGVSYSQNHYPMLEEVERRGIPPRKIFTELFVKDYGHGRILKVHHMLSPPQPRDNLCILIDPEYAKYFPEAEYQEEQGHYCIHGKEASLIPKGYLKFPFLVLEIYNPLDKGHLEYLRGLPLTSDNYWFLDHFCPALRNDGKSLIEIRGSRLLVTSYGKPDDISQIGDTIQAVRVLKS